MTIRVHPIPCQHIADFYNWQWERQKCIGYNLLRHGYAGLAKGIQVQHNNLYRTIITL